MRNSKWNYLILIFFLVLNACSKEKSANLIIDDIILQAEGPLFEGAITAQGEIKSQLMNFAKENEIEISDIQSIELKKFVLTVDDSTNFDLFSSINLQFASDQSKMLEVASINTISKNSNALELTLASNKQNLLETMKQDQFFVVADVIVAKDSNMNIRFKGRMEVEIKY